MWAAGWLTLAPMTLVLAQPYSPPILNNLAAGVSQLLRIITAYFVVFAPRWLVGDSRRGL